MVEVSCYKSQRYKKIKKEKSITAVRVTSPSFIVPLVIRVSASYASQVNLKRLQPKTACVFFLLVFVFDFFSYHLHFFSLYDTTL